MIRGMPARYHPPLTLTDKTTPWYSDGGGFWGGIAFNIFGSGLEVTSSTVERNNIFEPLASGDDAVVGDSFQREYEARCTIISGTRDAVRSTIANNTWTSLFGDGTFYLDITGGSFTLEIRVNGSSVSEASCTITVA